MTGSLLIAKNHEQEVSLLPQMASRHGLIFGATGAGKTCHAANTGEIVQPHWRARVPEKVLGQLGNLIQHALRVCSPRDQNACRRNRLRCAGCDVR